MSTFLQLVNDVERESGTIHQLSRLTTVANPSGRQEKIVQHVIEAWRQIQNARTDWEWRKGEFSDALTIGQRRYAGTDLNIDDFEAWEPSSDDYSPFTVYDAAIGQGDESFLFTMNFRDWKVKWDRGLPSNQRPTDYAISPARELCIGSPPDKAYVIRGEYRRATQVLALDADVPICPAQHHQVIVWKALMLLSGHDEAQFAVANAQANYVSAFRAMLNDAEEQVSV